MSKLRIEQLETLDGLHTKDVASLVDIATEAVFYIPQDFLEYQDAIDELSNRHFPSGVEIRLIGQSGWRPRKGIEVRGVNCGNFVIEHEDAVCPLDSQFEGVGEGNFPSNFLRAVRATAPQLKALFDMQENYSNAWYLTDNSTGFIHQKYGVLNAGARGLVCLDGSDAIAVRGDFSGAVSTGIRALRGSRIHAENAFANDCMKDGGALSTDGAVHAGRMSILNFANGKANNSGRHGVSNSNSFMTIGGAQILDAAQNGFYGQLFGRTYGNPQIERAGRRGYLLNDGAMGMLTSGSIVKDSGIADILLGSRGGNLLTINNCTTTNSTSEGIPNIDDIEDVNAFNSLTSRGVVFYADGPEGGASIVSGTEGQTLSTQITGAVIAGNRNTLGRGTTALIASSDSETANGFRSAVIASEHSHCNGAEAATIASQRTVNDVSNSIAMGDATSGGPSTSNRTIHLLGSSGDINIAGSLTPGETFSDFAEMFPNETGEEVPIGSIVALDGDGVRPALEGDEISGVVSGTAAVLAGNDSFCWAGRYLTDEWGRPLYEKIPDPDYEGGGEAPLISVRKENPEWDASATQTPRLERPDEWTPVGLLGQVYVRVDDSVVTGGSVSPSSKPGVGRASSELTGLRAMLITQPYDAGLGYAIAKCLINVKV